MEFDDYSAERPENRILRAAIDKIRRQISNPQLLLQVNSLQVHFDDIAPVCDYSIAFDRCVSTDICVTMSLLWRGRG